MTRRSLLDLAVRVAATPAGTEFFAAWRAAAQEHSHPNAPPEPVTLRDYRPQFFSPEDFRALQAFTEILIPTDDTPGAREAHCAHYIDFLLNAMTGHSPQTQKQWRNAMAALKQAGFHTADEKGREAIVEAISKPERDKSAHHPAYFAYRLIKRENAFAFYTAREGMIEALDYKGNSYNLTFPACTHPEHHTI
ncbi:MAG: gluconate 2-dehydrogenase subunit 3 family protein [Acidobacteriaceae bacterium]|nr:gluconate 2-dehydrogenase subunit 3 family protein [Acidobacteriaceae bacterium]